MRRIFFILPVVLVAAFAVGAVMLGAPGTMPAPQMVHVAVPLSANVGVSSGVVPGGAATDRSSAVPLPASALSAPAAAPLANPTH
ncbi:MAG: hypothetical protein SOH81_03395 [Acetobacter sp.]|jgi:predicted membrane-bound mannosyltransferase